MAPRNETINKCGCKCVFRHYTLNNLVAVYVTTCCILQYGDALTRETNITENNNNNST